MGCGGGRNLFDFFGGCGRGWYPYGPVSRPHDYDNNYDYDLLQELKLLYAEGKIDSTLYHQIKAQFLEGKYDWEELRLLKQETSKKNRNMNAFAKNDPPEKPYDKEIQQILQAKESLEKLKGPLQQQLERLQAKASNLEKEIKDILPQNQDLARDLLENKFKLQEQITNLEGRLNQLEQEETKLEILLEDIQLKFLDLQASKTSNQVKELRLRLVDYNE